MVPVVLRYLNGEMEKCFIKPYISCSVKVIQVIKESGGVITVPVEKLKAVFFVKELKGKGHKEGSWKEEDPDGLKAGRKITVIFRDGEKMRGKVIGNYEKSGGFFLYPLEKDSNNIKVFIVKNSLAEIVEEK